MKTVTDNEVDARLATMAVAVPERPPLLTRIGAVAREVTCTPRRAALVTAWGFAAVAMLASLLRSSVAVTTATGPATAHCGLDVYLYGYPGTGVTGACRHAEAGRAAIFVPASVAVLAGLAAVLALKAGRSLRRFPAQTALITLGALGVVAGAFALRPATVEVVGSGTLTTTRCGVDTYLFGYPDARVEQACTRAYAGHAHVLVVALILGALGLYSLGHLLYRTASRRLVLTAALGAVLCVGAFAALRPVAIAVTDNGTTVMARCGLDTYVGGYPDHNVQSACRSHLSTHAAGVLAAAIIAAVGVGGLAVHARRPTG